MRWDRLAVVVAAGLAAAVLAVTPRGWMEPAAAAAPAAAPGKAARADFKALNLPPQLPTATGYTTVDAFAVNGGPGLTFTQPLSVVAPPGEKDRLFVVSKTGTIEIVSDLDGKNGGPKKTLFFDVAAMLQKKGWTLGQQVEWGLLGIAFHPDYAKNGYFYITYDFTTPQSRRGTGYDRVSRFSVSKTDPNQADPDSEVPLFTQLDPAPNHNGGCIVFGPDGYLYTSIGDGGGANDQYDNARWIDKGFFAGIFRLDVDRKPDNLEPNPNTQDSTEFPSAVDMKDGHANYKVPKDNPFVGIKNYFGRELDPTKVRTEFYANGLRNAWRFSFDEPTGRLFEAEVGQDRWEEVNIIQKGGNYGWSYREAFHEGPRKPTEPAEATLLDPITEYPHVGRGAAPVYSGNSITGGVVYRGTNFAELTGAYVFADYAARKVFALREKDGKWTPTLLANLGGNAGISEVTADPRNGDILLANLPNPNGRNQGKILRLVRAGVQGAPPPALLSQTGAFKDLKTLTPADGLVAYEPNVTFWSDYAIKQRWFTIANGGDTIGFNATGNWTFPAGTIWVKHFEMEMTRGNPATRRRLETRFLVKTADSVYGITYKWRADGSDADLVSEGGEDEVLDINDAGVMKKQTWHYPSQSECLTCHTNVAGEALGFNTWQLNGEGRGKGNQLEALAHAGYFSADTPVPDVKTLGALAKADDTKASVEWRVRSYLAANCVQCHQPGGVAQGLWDARPNVPTSAAGLLNGALIANRGDPAAKVVVPGNAAHSMLLKRVEAQDAPRMPPLASNELDPAAEKLLREWIESMK